MAQYYISRPDAGLERVHAVRVTRLLHGLETGNYEKLPQSRSCMYSFHTPCRPRKPSFCVFAFDFLRLGDARLSFNRCRGITAQTVQVKYNPSERSICVLAAAVKKLIPTATHLFICALIFVFVAFIDGISWN